MRGNVPEELPLPAPRDEGLLRDRRLAERVRQGDAAALRHLYELHADALYTVARRITGSDADAQDVVQEVFLRLSESIETYEGRGPLASWLRNVTRRRALVAVRSRRRRREIRLPARMGPPYRGTNVVDAVWLEEALERLPDRLREVLVLKEIEGFSHREIAEQVGIAESTSMGRLCEAKALLRRMMLGE